MKRDAFVERVVPLMEPIYYVACSILPAQADRDDAIQNALEKGLRKCETLRDETKLRALSSMSATAYLGKKDQLSNVKAKGQDNKRINQ